MKKHLIALLTLLIPCAMNAEWQDTLDAAKGQTVYFNAWGGNPRTNAFIDWVNNETEARYGVRVEQVKLADTSEAVNRVIAEKGAGNLDKGSVDLIWINGENFFALKEGDLLYGPFLTDLPNSQYLDLSEGSAANMDFTTPTEGYESPWRAAKFIFIYDSNRTKDLPRNMRDWPAWAKKNPGRLTHPVATDFMGSTFLKQALIELTDNNEDLSKPATSDNFEKVTAPLWEWYNEIRPYLWRKGNDFPATHFAQQQMLADGEVDISLSFDPASAAHAINDGLLPESARVFVPDIGSINNMSFVAIPFNAANKEGAMVVANFLLDPATQARMQNIDVLGAYSVLDFNKMNIDERAAFGMQGNPALPSLMDLGENLPEPHPSWMTMIAAKWLEITAQ